MLGLLTPAAGSVSLRDQGLTQLSRADIARAITHVPQTDGIELDFAVWDVVMMGRQPYQSFFGFDSSEDRRLGEAALAATETEALRDRSIQSLSGGERRRVLIARALTQNTPIMLLDEPTAHLDIHYQLEICELLARLCRDQNDQQRTIVMTLHDINLAALFCDRILLLRNGTIDRIGTPPEVITKESIQQVFRADVAVEQDDAGRPYYRLLRS